MLLITVGFVHIGGLISPGPDFALVVRNSTLLSRKLACITALGLASGVLIHSLLSIMGISILIKNQPVLFAVLQIVGAGYLFYLGVGALKSGWHRIKSSNTTDIIVDNNKENDFSIWRVYFAGLVTNAFNPKALVYFVSLISAFVVNSNSISLKIGIVTELFLLTFLWFSLLAIFLSSNKMQDWIKKSEAYINLATGLLFSFVGIIIAWRVIEQFI